MTANSTKNNSDQNKSNESKTEDPLSLKEKVCFGIGDVSHGLAASAVGIYILLYMTDVAGLSPAYAGLAVMIGRVWDSVTDPLMGWITDRTKTRWGSRRPYLLFGAIPYGLAFFSLWVIPEFGGEEVLIFAYATIALLVFNTCLTVVFVPYTSLTAALTSDYNERTSLTGFRMASSQAAFLIGAAVPSVLVSWLPSEAGKQAISSMHRDIFGSWAGTPREAYFIMAAIFGLIMVASIWVSFWGTRERNIADPSGESGSADDTPLVYASSILEELSGNKPFRSAVLILLLTNCAATLIATNLAYYIQYVLFMENSRSLIFLTLFSSAIVAMPVWVKLAKKYGKTETYCWAMAVYPLVLACLLLITPATRNLVYIVAALCGILHAAALMIPWAIVPDVVEYDQLKTGKRREGLFYGGTTFSYKMATALAVLMSGFVLDQLGYQANVPQSAEVQMGLRIMVGTVAGLLLLWGGYIASKYPLTRDTHAKIVKELAEKKAGE